MEFIDKYYKTIRLVYIAFIFIIILIFNQTLFRLNTLELSHILYSIFNFLLILISYYLIFLVFKLKIKFIYRVLIFLLVLVLLYYLVFVASVYALSALKYLHPENNWFSTLYEFHNTTSLSELYQQEKFAWMSGYFYFHLFLLSIGAIVDRYLSSVKKNMELQTLNSSLELDMLKSQLEPHFLFNTLNNIYRLVLDNERAANTVLKLSDLLRFTLYESSNKLILLRDEIRFLEDYIELEKIRHHSNVDIQYDFSSIENEHYEIAPLLFINFVENAFKHGLHHTIDNTFVFVVLRQVGKEIVFTIDNKIPPSTNKPNSKVGIGIKNVQRRLDLLYPNQHDLIIEKEKDVFKVNLKIQTP